MNSSKVANLGRLSHLHLREPEFTNTRICLVEYILSTAQLHDNAACTNSILRTEIQAAAAGEELFALP